MLYGSAADVNLQFHQAGWQDWFMRTPANTADFGTYGGSLSVAYFKSNVNIGIGTTEPIEKLSVNGNVRAKK